MFNKLMVFILLLGSFSVLGQEVNLASLAKQDQECFALGKDNFGSLFYFKKVTCELGVYPQLEGELFISIFEQKPSGPTKFDGYFFVSSGVSQPVKFTTKPYKHSVLAIPDIKAYFAGIKTHDLVGNYKDLEAAEAAYEKFNNENDSKNYDISEVTRIDENEKLVVLADYVGDDEEYVSSEDLASLNDMNQDVTTQNTILNELEVNYVHIGEKGARTRVKLLIPDGDSFKINPEVKKRKISKDGVDKKEKDRQSKEVKLHNNAKEALIKLKKLKLKQAKKSVAVVKKAKKDKESDLKVAFKDAKTKEGDSRDEFQKGFDSLVECKTARYQKSCEGNLSDVKEECSADKNSDKAICSCEINTDHKQKDGETCGAFAKRVTDNLDEEVQEHKIYYANTIVEDDKTIDENIDYEGGTGSIQELISENAKDLEMKYCEAFILDKNLIRSDDAGFSFVVLGTANQPMNDKPHAFDHPLQCISSKSDKGSFDYEKKYGFYTDLDEGGYLSHLTQSGKIKLCVGLAYTENAVAKEILSSELYSSAAPTDSIGTCNDILSAGKLVCSSSGQKSQVLSPEAYNELFITRNNSLTAEQKEAFMTTGIEGFPDLKDSFISESQGNDKYGSEETCERDVHEKFKQCMGMNYKKVSHLAKVSGDDPHFKSDSSPDSNAIAERKANIGKEVYRQFGVCHAFKEIAKKVADDSDEWSGQETVSSLDGQYHCTKTTPFSLDFKACKRIVNTYNGFMIGDQARGLVNTGVTMAKTSNIRRDATSQMASGDQLNAGLDAQKKTYEMQRDQERGNVAFFGVQAATFTAMLSSYPTPNNVSRKCGGDTEIDSGNFCKAVLVWSNDEEIRDREVFPNQDTKKMMWMEVMKAASSATLAAIKQSQLNKMAGDIKKIKNAFGNLSDKSTTKDSQIELSYCKFNPTAPTCRTNGPRVTREGGFQYGNITSQNAGGGAFNISGNDEAFGEYDEDEDSAAKRAAIQDLGGMIDNTSADSFDNKFDKIGAGSFAKKGLGGGGGSGGGAAGGGGGGGGAAKGKAGGQNKFSVSKSGGAGSFQSGSGGKAGFGTGGSSSKKNSSKNPFSNMFGSKKGRNVASQVNNDIAPANSALFDKISKRYGKIAAENRLINLQGLSK